MKVVLVAETFAKSMGYLENFLPKHLARLGADVHLVTLGLHPSYRIKAFEQTYGTSARVLPPGTTEAYQGFTLHVLPHKKVFGHMQMTGLTKKLDSIRPDIVQTTDAIGWGPLQAALAKPLLGYKLFTENHAHASVFPPARQELSPWSKELLRCRLTRTLPGFLISVLTEKCYAIAPDCADLAVRFFGIPEPKVEVCPLGVDTDLFRPISTETDRLTRVRLREELGFSESDIVSIYTGRFSEDKNPLLLAEAISRLMKQGKPYRGLFVGNGVQAESIRSCAGCMTRTFVPVHELGDLYRASDIGVWPTQESLSMLDGAACGLPIIANSTMTASERMIGNGVSYKLNDLKDLSAALLFLQDPYGRQRLGACGANKMARSFSWESIAARRLRDYESSLRYKKSPLTRKLDTVSKAN